MKKKELNKQRFQSNFPYDPDYQALFIISETCRCTSFLLYFVACHRITGCTFHFSSRLHHTHIPKPHVYTYLDVSSTFRHLCSSWSLLFPLLTNCVESLCVCACAHVFLHLCVDTVRNVPRRSFRDKAKVTLSTVWWTESLRISFPVCKIWWTARTQGREEEEKAHPAEEEERDWGSGGGERFE